MRTAQNLLLLLLVLAVGMWLSTAVAAQESSGEERSESTLVAELRDEVRRGFSSRISLLGFGIAAQPEDSDVNPNNSLGIPRYQLELDVRPDLYLNLRQLELSVKPRLTLRWRKWEDGVRQGDSTTDTTVFVQEWLARYRLIDQLFVSYGRENLQWGPSYLLSPSNPFNRDNGQNNPRLEEPGMDYGRVVWILNSNWTASFIANTDRGRQDLIQDFNKTYAIKLDYTVEKKYFSLIGSSQEHGKSRIGFFGGWTVSDALLLQIEGSIPPDEISDAAILVGGAYTLEGGPTIAVEFYHDGEGCTLENVALCLPLRPGFLNTKPPADSLIRQNYLLVQYAHSRPWDITVNLTLRWIRDLDDNSNRIIGIVEYDLSDHTQIFVIANGYLGNKDAEFGSLLDYSVMAGVKFTF
jgi:hypothetical protein